MRGNATPASWDDDRALAESILAGNEHAFRVLYRRHSTSLLRRLVRMLNDVSQAEDCLQQVFLEAMRSIQNYQGSGSLKSWLHSIATFVVMARYKKQQRWKSLLDKVRLEPAALNVVAEPLPEELLWREEKRELLWGLLEKLSPNKRMALTLCDLEGESIEEAARQMKVPPGTVASRLYHARREVKKMATRELQKQGLSIRDLG